MLKIKKNDNANFQQGCESSVTLIRRQWKCKMAKKNSLTLSK